MPNNSAAGSARRARPSSAVGPRHRAPIRRPQRFSLNRLRAEWPLAIIIAGIVISLLLMVFDRWRRGAFALGVVALLAAVLRAALPHTNAGLLIVRSKAFDVAFLAVVGVLVIWLSLSVDSLGTG